MKNGKGYVQGYNAQAVANTHQMIVAAEVTQDQMKREEPVKPVVTTTETPEASGAFLRPRGQHDLVEICINRPFVAHRTLLSLKD